MKRVDRLSENWGPVLARAFGDKRPDVRVAFDENSSGEQEGAAGGPWR
jgi:hypothetical protein